MIELKNVTYKYRGAKTPALSDVTANLGAGLYLLAGENGAGKTTLLHIIAGLSRPQSGAGKIDSHPSLTNNPAEMGEVFLLEENMRFPGKTIREFKRLHSRFYPGFSEEMFEEILKAFGLSGNEPMHSLSQTIIYFLFSLVMSLLYLLIPSETIRMGIYSPCKTILMFMFIWSPIVFTKGGDTRIVDRLIPASALEKFLFYMSYLFIVISLACYLCPLIAEEISPELHNFDMNGSEMLQNARALPAVFVWSTNLSVIAAMLTCFYFVIAAKRNRVVKAYLISIGVSIFLSTLTTFYGVKEAIIAGYQEVASEGSAASETEIAEMVSSALNDHLHFSIFALAINVGLIVLLILLSYRSLYRRNL